MKIAGFVFSPRSRTAARDAFSSRFAPGARDSPVSLLSDYLSLVPTGPRAVGTFVDAVGPNQQTMHVAGAPWHGAPRRTTDYPAPTSSGTTHVCSHDQIHHQHAM
jgi:hypothetical protein